MMMLDINIIMLYLFVLSIIVSLDEESKLTMIWAGQRRSI